MTARITAVNRTEIFASLGAAHALPDELSAAVEAAYAELLSVATPKVTVRIFEKDAVPKGVLQGRAVEAHLCGSPRVAVLAATLGAAVDTHIARLQVRDMAAAVIFDAVAGSAVDNVCDNLCADLAAQYGYLTDRFSAGYGDYPLAAQRHIAAVLDLPRTLGVTLTESGLMLPQKSVTAVCGIADTPQPRTARCEGCRFYDKERERCAKG